MMRVAPRARAAAPRAAWVWVPVVLTVLAVLAALAALAVPRPAAAHAALVKSDPARRATLSKSPPQVRLWFNERLEPAYATIVVLNQAKVQVSTATASVDPTDAKLLVLKLPALAPGEYTVKYRVLSVDGHTVDYGYTFTLQGAGSGK